MNLPILNSPIYTLELPSTGEDIEYRPFLVKEQKALMIAEQSKNQKNLNKTIIELINNCTFGKLNAESLPVFDIEIIFLKLRAKSVGETAEIIVTCKDDNKTKVPVKINIDEIDVTMTENHSNIINITDDIKLIMGYPTLKDVKTTSKDDTEMMFDLISTCIDEVHDGDKIAKKVDWTKKDMDAFIESMSTNQLTAVMQFFNTMPKVRYLVKVENPKTKVMNEIMLEGINNFLQ